MADAQVLANQRRKPTLSTASSDSHEHDTKRPSRSPLFCIAHTAAHTPASPSPSIAASRSVATNPCLMLHHIQHRAHLASQQELRPHPNRCSQATFLLQHPQIPISIQHYPFHLIAILIIEYPTDSSPQNDYGFRRSMVSVDRHYSPWLQRIQHALRFVFRCITKVVVHPKPTRGFGLGRSNQNFLQTILFTTPT